MAGVRRRHLRWFGIVEFDPAQLRRTGSDPDGVLALAVESGTACHVDHAGTARKLDGTPTDATDLLVASNAGMLERILGRSGRTLL